MRTLEQTQRHNQLLVSNENSADASQRAARHLDLCPFADKRPGLDRESRVAEGLNVQYFAFIHDHRTLSPSVQSNDPRHGETRRGRGWLEGAEDVSGEERDLKVLGAVRPKPSGCEMG